MSHTRKKKLDSTQKDVALSALTGSATMITMGYGLVVPTIVGGAIADWLYLSLGKDFAVGEYGGDGGLLAAEIPRNLVLRSAATTVGLWLSSRVAGVPLGVVEGVVISLTGHSAAKGLELLFHSTGFDPSDAPAPA